MLSYLLAVLAAACNAASNVLQRRANRDEPAELSMRPALILDLLHRPVWLAGLVTVIASFVLDAAALSVGHLATVQPILVLELPLTLVAAAFVFDSAPMGRREWTAILVMSVGLAGLIYFLDPKGGRAHPHPAAWAAGLAVTMLAVAGCVIAALRRGSERRALFLGLASGVAFGLTAAFMKSATGALHAGPGAIFSTWSTYAMVAAGLSAMFLMQNALQAGRLVAAQPGITLGDPAVAILWGVLVFGERVKGGGNLAGAGLCGIALAAGVVTLTRSPMMRLAEAESPTGGELDHRAA